MSEITLKEIRNKIQEAIVYEPCEETLDIFESLSSVDEFLNHPKASFWVYWICEKTQKGGKKLRKLF